jgi:diaminopimelate decarboxylase
MHRLTPAALGPTSAVLPQSSALTAEGHLAIGGCDTIELGQRFGTALYVFDEQALRAACRAHQAACVASWPANTLHYASKAYLAPFLCDILTAEGLFLDLFSSDQLQVARAAGVAGERLRFHGLHRSAQELEEACRAGVAALVVGSLDEVDALSNVCARIGRRQPVLLRLATGMRVHTGGGVRLGSPVSAWGLTIADGTAEEAVQRCLARGDWLHLRGYHTHIGTQITTLAPFHEVATALVRFAQEIDARYGYWPAELSPGGGLGVRYTPESVVPDPADLATTVMTPIVAAATARGRPVPVVSFEPGRSLVGPAAVVLHRASTIVPEGHASDGVTGQGEGDREHNLRPALYAGPYTVVVANRTSGSGEVLWATVAGRDDATRGPRAADVLQPMVRCDDVLAVPCVGAYGLRERGIDTMTARPPVVLVHAGEAHLVDGGAPGAVLPLR